MEVNPIKGYLDRIEDNQYAVILVEEMNKEFTIPKTELPDGSKVHSYFSLTFENDQITAIKLEEHTTRSEQTKVDEMMSKLRSKSGGSKFKKN